MSANIFQNTNPCLTCGACCETFRVSFYWSEAQNLPDHLIEKISPFHACMAGTSQSNPRCVALTGEVGRETACSIYAERPSPCREVQPGDDKCNRAREKHGLATLSYFAIGLRSPMPHSGIASY